MNEFNLKEALKQKQQFLKDKGIDEESIKSFRGKVKKVSKEESNKLGKELFDLVNTKGYKDNNEENLSKVESLIKNGANLEYKNETKGDFALLRCARKNYINTFILLVKGGANLDQINNYKTTATMGSARHGNKEILEILIKLKANIQAKCLDGDTALMSAKNHDRKTCFQMLIEAGAYINNKNIAGNDVFDINSDKNEQYKKMVPQSSTTPIEENMTTEEDVNKLLAEAIEEEIKIMSDIPSAEKDDYQNYLDKNDKFSFLKKRLDAQKRDEHRRMTQAIENRLKK